MRKPKVSEVNFWDTIHYSEYATVYEARNIPDFFKVVPAAGRSKLFYGETAWMKARIFVVDLGDFSGWEMFQ
jgi:hypothetical protein